MNDARAAEEAEAFRWEDAARAWVASAPRRDARRRPYASVATVATRRRRRRDGGGRPRRDQTRAVRMGADPPPEPPLELPTEALLADGRTAEETPDGGGSASAAEICGTGRRRRRRTRPPASSAGRSRRRVAWFHRGFDPDLAAATIRPRVFRSAPSVRRCLGGMCSPARRAVPFCGALPRRRRRRREVRGRRASRARAGAPAACSGAADGPRANSGVSTRVSPGSRGLRRRREAAAAARRERARGRRVRGRERRRRRRRRRLRRRRRDSFFRDRNAGRPERPASGNFSREIGRSPRGPPPRAPRPRSRRDLRSARVVRRMRRGNVLELARRERRRKPFSRRGPPPRRGGASRGRAAPRPGQIRSLLLRAASRRSRARGALRRCGPRCWLLRAPPATPPICRSRRRRRAPATTSLQCNPFPARGTVTSSRTSGRAARRGAPSRTSLWRRRAPARCPLGPQ